MVVCQITCRQAPVLLGIIEGAPFRPWTQATFVAGSNGQSNVRAPYGNHKFLICSFGQGRLSRGSAKQTPLWIVGARGVELGSA